MRRTLSSLAAALLCLPLLSQEYEANGPEIGLTVIPRLDLSFQTPSDDNSSSFNLGNTALYTMFEGSITESLSFTVVNHWLCGEDPSWLYQGLGYSDTTNWIDYCYLEYSLGNFTLGLGKDMIFTGGFEFDAWDHDVYLPLMSSLWSDLPVYQWGGRVSYTTDSEHNTFGIQMTASPFGEKPFASGLYTYAAQWNGEIGPLSTIWSYAAAEYDKGEFIHIISLGQQLALGDYTIGLDYTNKASAGFEGATVLGDVQWAPSEKYDLQVKAGFEDIFADGIFPESKSFFAGVGASWYPLGNKNLRVMGTAAYNSMYEAFTATAGVMYYLHIPRR